MIYSFSHLRTRRALIAGVITLKALTLSGCGDGQVANETTSRVLASSSGRLSFENFDVKGQVSPPWVNGSLLAKVTAISDIKNKADRVEQLKELDLKESAYIQGDLDTDVLIAVNKDVIIVASAGSGSAADWFQDFQVRLVDSFGSNYRVHNGFQRKITAIDELLRAKLKLLLKTDLTSPIKRRVWLTGHSQGGAIMPIIALRLKEKGIDIQGIHTFGSPKSGDKDFADTFNRTYGKSTHRWINHRDPIPSQPIRDVYNHVGYQNFIDHRDDRVIFRDTEERRYFLIFGGGGANHPLADYIELIDKYRP